jgi:hypothetical protein
MKMNIIFSLLLIPVTTFGWQKESEKIIIKDPLTLVLTFGAENLPDKYLLARPYDISVTDNEDILISDEFYIKIYDAKGKPKKILGGKGQGPGEFNLLPKLSTTENGNIIALNKGFTENTPFAPVEDIFSFYSIYTPDYKLLKTVNIHTQCDSAIKKLCNVSFPDYSEFNPFSPDEFIITVTIGSRDIQKPDTMVVLYYKNDLLKILLKTEILPQLIGKTMLIEMPEKGTLSINTLPKNKIIYTNAAIHKTQINDTHYYSLFIYDINKGNTCEIKQSYKPVPLLQSLFDPIKIPSLPANASQAIKASYDEKKKLDNERIKLLKKLQYYPPVKGIKIDGKYIFVELSGELPDSDTSLYDVFDSESCVYLSSLQLPKSFNIIRYGKLYKLIINDKDYPKTEVYTINPKVYGK